MKEKPKGLSRKYGDQFSDQCIVDVYRSRPAIPCPLFSRLQELMPSANKTLLDLGCGTGEVAIPMSSCTASVDAVDPSSAMIARARLIAHEESATLNLHNCYAEDFDYSARYGMIVAANSIHWTDWEVLFSRLPDALDPDGFLVIIESGDLNGPWNSEISRLIPKYSTNEEFEPYSIFEELRNRNLFLQHGEEEFIEGNLKQSVSRYIDTIHSRNGFSRDRMGRRSQEFDLNVREILKEFSEDEILTGETRARIAWGKPKAP